MPHTATNKGSKRAIECVPPASSAANASKHGGNDETINNKRRNETSGFVLAFPLVLQVNWIKWTSTYPMVAEGRLTAMAGPRKMEEDVFCGCLVE